MNKISCIAAVFTVAHFGSNVSFPLFYFRWRLSRAANWRKDNESLWLSGHFIRMPLFGGYWLDICIQHARGYHARVISRGGKKEKKNERRVLVFANSWYDTHSYNILLHTALYIIRVVHAVLRIAYNFFPASRDSLQFIKSHRERVCNRYFFFLCFFFCLFVLSVWRFIY